MKKLTAALIAVILILSCTITSASASEPEVDPMDNFNRYRSMPMVLNTAKLPRYIKGSFDYDPDFIEIVPHYPGYEDRGYIFPLATEEYGALYDVSFTKKDTVITFEYRLKSGVTLDDYLDCVDKINEKEGRDPVSREPGKMQSFSIFDVALKWIVVTLGQVMDPHVLDVINTDGTVDFKDGQRLGEAFAQYGFLLGIPSLDPITVHSTEPVEENNYQYRDKLLSQFNLKKDQLTEYDELYEHKDQYGKVDWALVKAATEVATSPLYSSPCYYEFGNRVMEVENKGEPFTFGMGVYSVKDERFIQPSEAEIYELEDIEQVWTELGVGRLMGDMDGDNELSVADATLIQRCQAEINIYPTDDQNIPIDYAPNAIEYFSDFDQDGDRSILDATAIQRFLVGLPYRSANWTPYPHGGQENPEPTEPHPTEPQPTEPLPTEPLPDPSIPHITRCEAVADGVQVTWTPVEGAEHYRLYYRNNNGGWTKCAETDGLTAVDTRATPNQEYRYTVRCVSADGKTFTSDFDRTGTRFYLFENPRIENTITRLDGIELQVWANRSRVRLYRKEAGGSWKRIAEFDTQEDVSYCDTDIQPGKSYTYTARCVSEDGRFLSYFNTVGWKQTFNAANCYPELEFFIYYGKDENGDKLALVQPSDDNKLGIKQFYLHVGIDGDYKGTFTITDEPVYIRADFFNEDQEYLLYLVGVDGNGNEITQENPIWVQTLGAPTDIKAEKTGDRQYRLTWREGKGHPEGYYLNFLTPDGETSIESELIKNLSYEIDLSDYPEDTEWKCVLWAQSADDISASWPSVLEFKESDYQSY